MYSTFHLNITSLLQKYRSEKVLPRFKLGVPSAQLKLSHIFDICRNIFVTRSVGV